MRKRMYGVEIQVPPGKLPGFYAQAIHRIGDAVPVFDRDKRMLIVERPEDREALTAILDRYGMTGETVDLWLLPDGTDPNRISGCGFVSTSDRAYLYASRTAWCRLDLSGAENRGDVLELVKPYVVVERPEAHGDVWILAANRDKREQLDQLGHTCGISLSWFPDA